MTQPTATPKNCPDCGGPVEPAASLCRHCGYVFPLGKRARHQPSQLTRDLATAPAEQVGDWVRRFWVLIPVGILLALIAAVVLRRSPTGTWDAAVAQLPPDQHYDRQFEDHVAGLYQADRISVDVRAAGGTCLINLREESPSGITARLAGKLTTLAIACDYAQWRKRYGDAPMATTVLFTSGRRYSKATCDGAKLPD